ncbi:hypothetical protein DDZ14_18870 [Maritimibacter sp. 55A14]|uniref:hypothetical protein n=1 Tax=Maritimibacter sp. 55A14 TaxID=2174844 RepID=UPI000D622C46|nr:hypothetical protein [Maritimibacter sp. 55A14]PWE28419.1 hypothetical protein DDZ14_18870 [Maritimibacter sp. 55A14]
MKSRIIVAAALVAMGSAAAAQDGGMSFFVTSENPGQGGDFGGIAGADAHCAALAEATGVTGRDWAAYLSTSTENARDRIGTGPWMNANGEVIAEDVEMLHGSNNISKETALNERGEMVNGRGDSPNRHDILTGSLPDGTVAEGMTCEDWTSGGPDTAGMVGHHDRKGLNESPPMKSWNSSHPSRGGCGLEALRGTGGDGLLYCFATD